MKEETETHLDKMRAEDWSAVSEIYAQGIATGLATFETTLPEWLAWDQAHLSDPRLVIRQAESVAGWAALSPVSGRCVYEGVAEVSIYVGEAYRGQGLGKVLLQALVTRSEAKGIWTLQASIFPENEASVGLHLACGFRQVGIRERISRLHGVWRDVALMERRSALI